LEMKKQAEKKKVETRKMEKRLGGKVENRNVRKIKTGESGRPLLIGFYFLISKFSGFACYSTSAKAGLRRRKMRCPR
jgi:hypothetical protein